MCMSVCVCALCVCLQAREVTTDEFAPFPPQFEHIGICFKHAVWARQGITSCSLNLYCFSSKEVFFLSYNASAYVMFMRMRPSTGVEHRLTL